MKELYEFSKIIKDLRTYNNWSQTYIAKKLGIKPQSYQAYEAGVAVPFT